MEWLTDPDRREREWRRLVEAQEAIQQSSVGRLPNGGLRLEQVLRRGNLLMSCTTEDAAIQEHRIDRTHRTELAGRRMLPLRWVMKERITVEPLADGTGITVRVRGRLTGTSRVLHLLGYRDAATARQLTEEASRRADFRVGGVAAHFSGLHHRDASAGSSG